MHILQLKGSYIPWQSFRLQELWCTEVNDMIGVNLRGIRKLFDMIAVGPQHEKRNRMKDTNLSFPSIDQVTY